MSTPLHTVLVVAAGGALGAVLRHGATEAARGPLGLPPWSGTLAVNALGCLALGVVIGWLESRSHPDWLRPLVVTGMLGALTTFSTFGLDVVRLLEQRRPATVIGYVLGSVVVGVALVRVGMLLVDRRAT